MAYNAVKNTQGLYDVFLNGSKVATGTQAILGNYSIDPNSLQGSTPFMAPQNTPQQIQQPPTPVQSTVNTNVPQAPQVAQQATQPTQQQQQTQGSPDIPQTALQPGAQGQDVKSLQDYLVNLGYLTPEQVATGSGIYGPQTTAAVAKLQSDLGLQPQTGKGFYGPQTQAALKQKYNQLYSSLKGGAVPERPAEAQQAIQDATMQQSKAASDPVFGSMMGAMEPIMQSLTQVLNNINNPLLTATSLQQEYNDLAAQYNVPGLQSQLLNYQNIMNGTEDDIRDEITKAGGTVTDSQVLAMSAARNKVILKQYNALSTQYTAATNNIQNMMQYASQDQTNQLERQKAAASVSENLASIESQLMSMGMTMEKNTTDNLNKIVTNVGYQGLSAQAEGNPTILAGYETRLGLAPGALSNPQSLSQLETLRQQQVALGAQRVQIQMYNAGLGGNPTSTNSNTPGLYVNNPTGSGQSLVSTKKDGVDDQGRPYSFTNSQAQNLLKNGAAVDPGTNNIVVPNVGYYVAQNDGTYRLSVDPSSNEGQFIQYSTRAQNPSPWQPSGSLSNQRMTRNAMTRQANAALSQYVNSPTYKNVSAAATYLSKLNAGLMNPGSVGDPDIIDSLVKINTGGQGQITEQQYNAYAQGATWSDKFQVVQGKVQSKGGTLSPNQRQEIARLAQDTFNQYRSQYEQLYTQAMKNLDNQGIPDAFWGNMPEWSSMISGSVYQPINEQ